MKVGNSEHGAGNKIYFVLWISFYLIAQLFQMDFPEIDCKCCPLLAELVWHLRKKHADMLRDMASLNREKQKPYACKQLSNAGDL